MVSQIIQSDIEIIRLNSDSGRCAGTQLGAVSIENMFGAGNLFRGYGNFPFDPGLVVDSKMDKDRRSDYQDQGTNSCQIQ